MSAKYRLLLAIIVLGIILMSALLSPPKAGGTPATNPAATTQQVEALDTRLVITRQEMGGFEF